MASLESMVLSLLLLLTTSSMITAASTTPHDSFIQCFQNLTKTSNKTSPQILYTPNTAAYNSVLLSSAQNIRFLYSSNTTKPSLIVTPTKESDVQQSVICSKRSGLRLRVRSGGHDYEGMSYVSNGEDFVVVDLVNLRSVAVDSDQKTAWVQTGATLGELYYTINQKNSTIGFPAGTCPTIGVGGHISGGGIGTLVRKYGTSADNIMDARLVDGQGRILNRESMGEDLFWAIKGGGAASFGVVLSYRINLVYVPPTVTAFNVYRTLAQNATSLVARWQIIAHEFDEDLFVWIVAQAKDSTVQVRFNSLFLGRRDKLLTVMRRSFPELGLRSEDCTEMSWLESVLFINNQSNSGKGTQLLLERTHLNSSFKAKSDFVRYPISENQWEGIWNFLMEARDEPLILIMEPLGGKMSEISESAIPFPHRIGNLHNIQYYMNWPETEESVTVRHLDWMRKLYSYMTPYVSMNPRAAYYNYKDIDLGTTYSQARVWGVMYFKNNFKRLAYVKSKVDPDNFFRNEQSIPPLRF